MNLWKSLLRRFCVFVYFKFSFYFSRYWHGLLRILPGYIFRIYELRIDVLIGLLIHIRHLIYFSIQIHICNHLEHAWTRFNAHLRGLSFCSLVYQ